MAKNTKKKTNKLGVKNSLVNNINARKRKKKSRPKKKSTVSSSAYKAMQTNWGRKKGRKAAPRKKTAAKRTASKQSKRAKNKSK